MALKRKNQVVNPELFDTLIKLELQLQKAAQRNDVKTLNHLLADDFVEFAYSGRAYTKQDIVNSTDSSDIQLISQQFKYVMLAEHSVMLRYQSANQLKPNVYERYALRTSIWRFEQTQWVLLFHQATPTEPFTIPAQDK